MFVCLTIKITEDDCKCFLIWYSKVKQIQLSKFKKLVLIMRLVFFSQPSDSLMKILLCYVNDVTEIYISLIVSVTYRFN